MLKCINCGLEPLDSLHLSHRDTCPKCGTRLMGIPKESLYLISEDIEKKSDELRIITNNLIHRLKQFDHKA